MSPNQPPLQTQEEIEEITDRILRLVSGILDRKQRSYALAKKLNQYPTETILEIFKIISRRAQFKESIYLDGFRVISDVGTLSQHLDRGKMSDIYALARKKDYSDVVRFMKKIPPARKLGHDEELEEDPMLKEMDLGTKRQKARLRNRDLIDRLTNEQDPVVITHLLKNPIITVREVIKVASKRPTNEKILWVVYKDMRWVNHYVVKQALINNPYTPTQISISLLHFLLEQHLEEVSENMLLHSQVREAAVDLIMNKRENEKPTQEEEESEED